MMKSTSATRQILREKLSNALHQTPNNQELKDALDVVDDCIKYHSVLKNNNAIYVVYDSNTNKISFCRTKDMQLIGSWDWDGYTEDLGELLVTALGIS